MQTIDVHDLPEPIAQAIAAMVEAVRQRLAPPASKSMPREFPRWPGTVIGTLSREEIYDDLP
jgi:hypothetical protein